MPLATSPIDGSPMKQVTRLGIEIDVCQTSGGIWLDKGELEKMISMIRAEQPRSQFGLRKSKSNAKNPQSSHAPQTAQQPPLQQSKQPLQNTKEYNPPHRDVEDSAFDKLEAIIDLFDF